MRFQVPQFIEVEDKVFGPLTIKQFVYLAGGGGLLFILWVTLPKFVAILIGLPIGIFAAALAFYKVNERPFINVLESAFNYTVGNKLYLWKKVERKVKKKDTDEQEDVSMSTPKISRGKLRDLAWSLDIKESVRRNKGGEVDTPFVNPSL